MSPTAADRVPIPGRISTPLTEVYWEAAEQGVLLLQVCDTCERAQLYPAGVCRSCWSASLSWCEATGLGTVWSYTVAEQPGHPAWQALAPYCIAIVQLDEGPRVLTNVVGQAPYDVRIGQPVRLIETSLAPDGPPLRFRTC